MELAVREWINVLLEIRNNGNRLVSRLSATSNGYVAASPGYVQTPIKFRCCWIRQHCVAHCESIPSSCAALFYILKPRSTLFNRGVVHSLSKMLQLPDALLKEMAAFALYGLADNEDNLFYLMRVSDKFFKDVLIWLLILKILHWKRPWFIFGIKKKN